MGYGIKLRVWGEYACFTRPEMKAERVSYDVITPSAARGIIESIYWKPAIKWVIDKITVVSPIEFGNVMMNEVKSKIADPSKIYLEENGGDILTIYTAGDNLSAEQKRKLLNGESINENDIRPMIDRRRTMFLKNPDYIIEAHFEPSGIGEDTNDCKKHYNVVLRRAEQGQCYKQPVLGLRNFSAKFKLLGENEVIESQLKGEVDLGYMLYDIDFKRDKNGKVLNAGDAIFYRAKMKDGVIDVAECYKQGGRR